MLLKLSGRALAALGRSQAWLWGSGAVLGADGAVPAGASLGRALALARWQRSAALFLVCQQAPACPHRSGRDLENSVCLCIESEMTGYRTQPCLLHVPRPICMRNTLLSPSVLACSTFLQEQMCSFSCPLCVPCPIRCPANHCSASKRCFFP